MRLKFSYSIWLMPTGTVNEKLSPIISKLSAKYNSPKFQPHVTLIGGFTGDEQDLINKTEILSKKLKCFVVKLPNVHYLDQFFRSLFICVEKTPELMNAVKVARGVFGLPENKDYIPHLSLMYGDFTKEIKEVIIKDIGKDFSTSFRANKIHLVFNNEQDNIWAKIKELPIKINA